MTDSKLLENFRAGDQTAFAELVRRHVNWVYSSARRQVRDAHLAEDVTQAVFVVLARKAETIRSQGSISPWLFQVVKYVARGAMKTEARRKRHESKAAAMNAQIATVSEQEWIELSEILDTAVGRLKALDRQAVLLR